MKFLLRRGKSVENGKFQENCAISHCRICKFLFPCTKILQGSYDVTDFEVIARLEEINKLSLKNTTLIKKKAIFTHQSANLGKQ